MKPTYARHTSVTPERSRAEIEQLVKRYGATAFAYAEQDGMYAVIFTLKARRIRFVMRAPALETFAMTPSGRRRSQDAQRQEQATYLASIWRSLVLTIKAKMESVSAGIETFDEAFMPHIVMPDGKTISEHLLPQIERAYLSGEMPPLLLGGAS